jgi:hypothetical protein
MYFRARYYDPSTGEFTSPDPLEYVDGMSLYRGYFVINWIDSSGLNCDPASSCCVEYCYREGHDIGYCSKCCGKEPHCEIKNGPSYNVVGDVPLVPDRGRQRFPFELSASFVNDPDNGAHCKCCEIRQDIKWNKKFHDANGGPPHETFTPPEDQPDTWWEDRHAVETEIRHGHRLRPGRANKVDQYLDDQGNWDQLNGCHYCGSDAPSAADPLPGKYLGSIFSFRLRIVDVCVDPPNEITLRTSDVIHVKLRSKNPLEPIK